MINYSDRRTKEKSLVLFFRQQLLKYNRLLHWLSSGRVRIWFSLSQCRGNGRFSFWLSHFLSEVMQAFVVLRLGNGTVFQKGIQQRFLIQEQLVVLFAVGKRSPDWIV